MRFDKLTTKFQQAIADAQSEESLGDARRGGYNPARLGLHGSG